MYINLGVVGFGLALNWFALIYIGRLMGFDSGMYIILIYLNHTTSTIKVNSLYLKYNTIADVVYTLQLILISSPINVVVSSAQRFLA